LVSTKDDSSPKHEVQNMRRGVSAVLMSAVLSFSVVTAMPQAAREATIEVETRARVVLQSQISSKLNEPGDPIIAILDEPLYVNSDLVLQRGTEFRGRVTQATPAGRGQKNGQIGIIFEQVTMPWGDVPVSISITAIDDWSHDEKMKANDEGKVSGTRSGERTAKNVERGATIGGAGALATVLLGGGGAAAGAALGGGLLGGLLLTKGGDVRVGPGAIFRIKFVKPVTLPVIQQGGSGPKPIAPDTEPTKRP
jgi:hypothetical protein